MEQHMTEHGTKEEKKRLELPKNVRQMGNIQGSTRIYMEDYVHTYLHGKAENWNHRGCIFLGNRTQENGQRYVFISGVVRLEDEWFTDGIPEFTDLLWGMVYQEMKQFYEDVEILGWGMDVAGASAKLTGDLERIHKEAFEGQDKLVFLMDSLEKEEAFYVYEKNMLRRRDGYYIYYEKNPQMREYMMQEKEEKESAPENDPQQGTMKKYRRISARNSKKQRTLLGSMVQAASLVLLVALSAMVVSTISNTTRMQRLLEAVSYLKADGTTTAAQEQAAADTDIPKVSVTETEEPSSAAAESDEEDDLDTVVPKVVSRDTAETESVAAEADTGTEEVTDTGGEGDSGDDIAAENPATDDTAAGDTVELVPESYVVQPGESLLSISHKFYGKNYTNQICELNGLEDKDKIYAGQTLFLPAADNQ